VDDRDVFQAAGEGVPAELVGVELRTECPKCGTPLPLDGLLREVICRGCSAEVDLEKAVFAAALDSCYTDVFQLGRGVTRDGHAEVDGRDVHWQRGPGGPPCESCGEPTRPVKDGAGYGCLEHGEQGRVQRSPEWLRSVDFTLDGYVPPLEDSDSEGDDRTVSTRCTNCGSALETDGSKRAVECGSCHTISVLPEEVWQALNPPRAPQRFWILCRLFYDPRVETPSAWGEIKDGLGTVGCAALVLLPLVFGVIAAIAVGGAWVIGMFGRGGVNAAWITGGVVALGLSIYIVGYVRRYLRWRKIYEPEHELIGRLGPFDGASECLGATAVELRRPGESGDPVGVLERHVIERNDYERLGGEGGTMRVWMVPDRDDLVEVQLIPSALD